MSKGFPRVTTGLPVFRTLKRTRFWAFEREEAWSVHYEQCNYFRLQSLEELFRRSGFRPTELGSCYESDQYLYIEAVPSGDAVCETIRSTIKQFADVNRQRVQRWSESVRRWQKQIDKCCDLGVRRKVCEPIDFARLVGRDSFRFDGSLPELSVV